MRGFIVLAFVLSIPLSARAGGSGDEQKPKAEVVLKGYDPVLLLEGREQRGEDGISSTRGRFRYLFASAENKARFDSDPSRFSVRGEMCTVMPKVPASPDLFLVHDGKLFLFGSPQCVTSFKADPAAYFKPRRKVAILVYEGMELLDFAGPAEVFGFAGQGRAFDVVTVAATREPVASIGFSFVPQHTFESCPKMDVLVLPGGTTRRPLADPKVLAWVRASAADAEIILSVCTGAFLLAKAGLLDGQEATTHWASLQALKEAAPKTTVRDDRRYVDNGKIVTSAGVSAGIDASLHIVERLLGRDAASESARRMEYPWDESSEAKKSPSSGPRR